MPQSHHLSKRKATSKKARPCPPKREAAKKAKTKIANAVKAAAKEKRVKTLVKKWRAEAARKRRASIATKTRGEMWA